MTTAEDIAALERRLRRLEDREEIRTLRDRYHACVNDARYDGIGALFTEDAVVALDYLAHYEGRAAIDAGFRAMADRERFFIKQFIHSHRITLDDGDDDAATGTSYLDARYGRYGVSYMVSGRYDDRYRRVGGVWLFERMDVTLYYTVPAGVGWTGDELHYLRAKS